MWSRYQRGTLRSEVKSKHADVYQKQTQESEVCVFLSADLIINIKEGGGATPDRGEDASLVSTNS